MVESIEVVWVKPEDGKERLLSVYFAVPHSFELFAPDRLDEVRA